MTVSASTSAASTSTPSRGLHLGLWAVQVLLALAFGSAGLMKTLTPIDELAKNMPWAAELPQLVRFIGLSEFLGAVGLIVPSALRIMPKLTGVAAAALVLVMVLAAGYHVMQGDAAHMAPSLVLGLLAGFVAWGRLAAAPIAPKA
jgi:hypothetical protein